MLTVHMVFTNFKVKFNLFGEFTLYVIKTDILSGDILSVRFCLIAFFIKAISVLRRFHNHEI